MKCFYCKNKLKLKTVTYNINRQRYDVILRQVPAYVCQECGEIFFEEKSVDEIQSLIKDIDKKSKIVREYNAIDKAQRPTFAI